MAQPSLEAKICVLGAQGVGKTSLLQRYVNGIPPSDSTLSTIGASFLTKRTTDIDSGTDVRLQIWDTAGQERYKSISKLYYRGAEAIILAYSLIDERSFQEMGRWLEEVKQYLGDDVVVHVVGTKTDVVVEDPSKRAVPFERCIAYVAEKLHPNLATTPLATTPYGSLGFHSDSAPKRHSGFWVQDAGWDDCHEVSATTGEGIDEVFRVVTRKLVEKRQKAMDRKQGLLIPHSAQGGDGLKGYFDRPIDASGGRPGTGDKRRSWLGFPSSLPMNDHGLVDIADSPPKARSRCC